MIAARFAVWLLTFCALSLAVIDYDSQIVRSDAATIPSVPTIDRSVVAKAEEGRICTTTPSLTDVIVVRDSATDATRIVSFDEALAGAEAGSLRVVLYCVAVAA